MRLTSPKLFVFAFATVTVMSAVADAALSRTGSANVSFTALGPGGLKIVGTTSDLQLSEADGNVTVRVPLANLDTGIALRNKHMREKYLQVQTYPNADLVVSRASLKLPTGNGDSAGNASGNMSIHGVTKPVSFAYQTKRDGNHYHVTGTVHLNMNDYNIAVPSYLGVTVKPDIDVAVAFDAQE